MLQDALDAMTKEKARIRANMEYLQSQLDLVTQQAEAAACKDPLAHTSEVQSNHAAESAAVIGQLRRVAVGLNLLCADQVAHCLPHI